MPDLIDRKQISARIADQWYLWDDYDIDQVLEDIQRVPAVEAIPVEFIKGEIKDNKGFYNSSLRRLLDVWRKQNETD